jgi:hypothetical protein
MNNKLQLIRKVTRLTCTWVPTGDATRPLVCMWVGSKPAQAVSTASSTDEAERMHLCA